MSYIHYDEKPNGAIYACIYESYRDKGKVKTRRGENLGRVIDKENNIFRQNGITYQYIIGEGSKRKVKEADSGITIKKIAAEAYLAQDENWVKDKKGTLIEEEQPCIHYVKGFGDKALDVSKQYGVSIAFNDLDDNAGAFHVRFISTGDEVNIFE